MPGRKKTNAEKAAEKQRLEDKRLNELAEQNMVVQGNGGMQIEEQ